MSQSLVNANYMLGVLFFSCIMFMVGAFADSSMLVQALPGELAGLHACWRQNARWQLYRQRRTALCRQFGACAAASEGPSGGGRAWLHAGQ